MADTDIDAIVAAAVDKALGVKPETRSAAAPEKAPDKIDKLIDLMAADMANRMSERVASAPGYKSPGAPVAAPQFDEGEPATFLKMSAEEVKEAKESGKFKHLRERYYEALGANKPFRREPKDSGK